MKLEINGRGRRIALVALAAVAIVFVAARVARAGNKRGYNVNVQGGANGGSFQAYGGFTRNTGDSIQYHYCQAYRYSSGSLTGYCGAMNTAGVFGGCVTYDGTLINLIMSVKGDSELYVYWNSAGTCTGIYVTNASWDAPKQL